MLFSSFSFLFLFLQIVLFFYYVVMKKYRLLQNLLLLFSSLFFYAWGEPWFVLVMLASIIGNWFFGMLIYYIKEKGKMRFVLIMSLIFNLGIIFYFKYLMFVLMNIRLLFNLDFDMPLIFLPIGISFFTFQALSYVIDVYRDKERVQKNPLYVGLYISFFPQLIAGPIVRYETIVDQIINRKESLKDFSEGVCRFILGLGKKVLLANTMSLIADKAFSISPENLSLTFAWLGALAYTFQIFFDFSGYSDMAIGLGKMFSFHFLENFDYPYISKSISEFWRRWHISLGTWFRDYLYFPLGGSRVKTKTRLIINLFLVWVLTGLWHGANWTFLVWGLMYFILITFEKITNFNDRVKNKGFKHFYTMFFVVMGWVIFRSDSMAYAVGYIKTMFFANRLFIVDSNAIIYLSNYKYLLVLAIICSMPIGKWIPSRIINSRLIQFFYPVFIMSILILSVSYLVKGAYNPFIYFNF